jgi:putative transposase
MHQVGPKKALIVRLALLWADSGFAGAEFEARIKARYGWTLEIVRGLAGQRGFVVQRRRWVVERTFAWFYKWRRLNVNYEKKPTNSEGMIYVCMARLTLARMKTGAVLRLFVFNLLRASGLLHVCISR